MNQQQQLYPNKWLSIGVTPVAIQEALLAGKKEPTHVQTSREKRADTIARIEKLNLPIFSVPELVELLGYKRTWIAEFVRNTNKIAPIFIWKYSKAARVKSSGSIKYYTLAPHWRELLTEFERNS